MPPPFSLPDNLIAPSVMSISNGVLLHFLLLLVSTSVFSSNSLAFGSSAPRQSFNRVDPLQHFKRYRGGYDIQNRHYWASAVFTGVHGYAIGGAWVLCGLGFGIFMAARSLCCSSSTVINHSDSYYLCTFFVVLLFTYLAIIAACFALAANQKTFQRMRKMKDSILGAGADAHRSIQKVSTTMKEMQSLLLPYDRNTSDRLNQTAHQLERESKTIQTLVNNDGHKFELAIKTSYLIHLGIVVLNSLLLIVALILLLLHWHPGLIMIIFFCWIITALCWVLTGVDFFVHTFGDDTCLALEDFKKNPQNSSLSSILPCGGSTNASKALVDISSIVYKFIDELNSKVMELHMLLRVFNLQSLLGFSEICNPFSGPPNYTYIPDKCPKDALPISLLPNVLQRFTCYDQNATGTCQVAGKFLPEDAYNKAEAYSESIQDLLTIFPDLQDLISCSFVMKALSEVVDSHCKPFKVSIRFLWASMLSHSIAMVLLLLSWVVKGFQERERNFSMCSILPNST